MQRDLEGNYKQAGEPFGPWSGMTDCHDHMTSTQNYDDETAWAVCQALKQRLGSVSSASSIKEEDINKIAVEIKTKSQAIPHEDKAGRLFLKIFLLDGSVNLNQWGVAPDSIQRNIYSAIGKPLVMFKNGDNEYDHPPLQGQEDINHALAYQDLFRVGTYVDVFESPTKRGEWWGIAEITDDGVRKAIREDPNIPFYVSPTIRLTSPFQNEQELTEWSFMHSAIVDRPAYTAKKAYISGQCSGNSNTCLLQLRKASIAANDGKVGCGFCTYKAAKQIQQNIVSSLRSSEEQLLSRANIMTSDNISREATNSPTSTSATTTAPTIAAEQQQQQQPQQSQPQPSQQAPQTQKVVEEAEKEKQLNKKEDQSTPATAAEEKKPENAGAQELLETVQRLSTKNKELELQLQTAKADKESLQALNTQFNDRLAKLEQEREEERMATRKATVTDRLQRSPVYQNMPADERQKWIDNYINGTLSVQQINDQLVSLEASFKKASLGGFASASYTSRLNKPVETRSASSTAGNNNNNSNSSSSASDAELPAHLRLHQYFGKPVSSTSSAESGGIQ